MSLTSTVLLGALTEAVVVVTVADFVEVMEMYRRHRCEARVEEGLSTSGRKEFRQRPLAMIGVEFPGE